MPFYTICCIIFPDRCCKKLLSIHVTVILIIKIMSCNRGYILKIPLPKWNYLLLYEKMSVNYVLLRDRYQELSGKRYKSQLQLLQTTNIFISNTEFVFSTFRFIDDILLSNFVIITLHIQPPHLYYERASFSFKKWRSIVPTERISFVKYI